MGTQQQNLTPAEHTTASVSLQVCAVIDETADARSLVLDVPLHLRERFRYKPGQFLSFRVPFAGKLLTRINGEVGPGVVKKLKVHGPVSAACTTWCGRS